MHRQRLYGLTLAVALAVLPGCATKKYVRTEIDTVGQAQVRQGERIEGVESQVEEVQSRVDKHDQQIQEVSGTARDALERAIAAGKLAEGRFLYETVFSDDKVGFGFDEADLTDEAKAALDTFAADLKQRDENVYIEIQGHTDSTGSESYNLQLGEQRAEAVRRYLNGQHGIPLHRMSVISYGESAPVVSNDTRENRARNRRVALVVLK